MCLLNTAVELLIVLELPTTTDTEYCSYIVSIMSTHMHSDYEKVFTC
jgi:hypothetical protein